MVQLQITQLMRDQWAAGKRADRVDETTGDRIVSDCDAQSRTLWVLHQAACHLGGLLRLGLVIEVDRRERQQQRVQWRQGRAGQRRIEQRELTARMLEPCDDLLRVAVE